MAKSQNTNKNKPPFQLYIGVEVKNVSNLHEEYKEYINNLDFDFIITHISNPLSFRGADPDLSLAKRSEPLTRFHKALTGNNYRKIIGKVNRNFIDLDCQGGEVPKEIIERSRALIIQQFDYACHIGMLSIVLPKIQSIQPINLAKIICELQNASFQNQVELILQINFGDEMQWRGWKFICDYLKHDTRNIGIFLNIPDDLQNSNQAQRWRGDKVKCLILNTGLFYSKNPTNIALTKVHEQTVRKFMHDQVSIILRASNSDDQFNFGPYCEYVQNLFKNHYPYTAIERNEYNFWDYLQSPLQPLADNLDYGTYQTFEVDKPKYTQYEQAIALALKDYKEHGRFNQNSNFEVEYPQLATSQKTADQIRKKKQVVIMVLGAGRGPLVDCSLRASKSAALRVKVYAIEKNKNAVNTLRNRMLEQEWTGRVQVISTDMRDFYPEVKADIIVSQLLGSFGDNQLSPQCLDSTTRFLDQGGIYIPFEYRSYIQPASTQRVWERARFNGKNNKICEEEDKFQESQNSCEVGLVVRITSYTTFGKEVKECFKFNHPAQFDISQNMTKELCFSNEKQYALTLSGFIGYFEADLYKNIMCSIHPKTHTKAMRSWFPIYFPIKKPTVVNSKDQIVISIDRKNDEKKVWYEWQFSVSNSDSEQQYRSKVHNQDGKHYPIFKK